MTRRWFYAPLAGRLAWCDCGRTAFAYPCGPELFYSTTCSSCHTGPDGWVWTEALDDMNRGQCLSIIGDMQPEPEPRPLCGFADVLGLRLMTTEEMTALFTEMLDSLDPPKRPLVH